MRDLDALVQALCVPKRMPCTAQDLYHAAASASVSALLARGDDEPYWDDWLGGRFTKSVRRVRSDAAWDRLTPVAHVVTSGKATVAALAPMPYRELPTEAAKAQVQGVLLPVGNDVTPARLQLMIDGGLSMSAGKAAAQAAHALMIRALIEGWTAIPEFSVHVVTGCDLADRWSDEFGVVDSGLTELPGPTRTAVTVRR